MCWCFMSRPPPISYVIHFICNTQPIHNVCLCIFEAPRLQMTRGSFAEPANDPRVFCRKLALLDLLSLLTILLDLFVFPDFRPETIMLSPSREYIASQARCWENIHSSPTWGSRSFTCPSVSSSGCAWHGRARVTKLMAFPTSRLEGARRQRCRS